AGSGETQRNRQTTHITRSNRVMNNPSNEKHQDTPPLELSDECVSNFSELIKALAAYKEINAKKEGEETEQELDND
ncbi:hypothetical protein, partial [Xylella fastidiosa]